MSQTAGAWGRARSWGLTAACLLCLWLSPARAETIDESWSHRLESGTDIQFVVRRPLEASGPMPAVVLFGGFEGAAQILDYLQTDQALIRASFRYPWEAPEEVRLRDVKAIVSSFEQAVEDTLDGIQTLLAALRQRPDVDPERIVIVGASAGAPFATIGAAQGAVPGLIVVQGFGRLAQVIGRQFSLSWQERLGWLAPPLAAALAHGLVWWMDLPVPEQFARRLGPSQQVLQITATEDERIPAVATEALWAAFQDSQATLSRMDLQGAHLRGYGDPKISEILSHALEWMSEKGLGPS